MMPSRVLIVSVGVIAATASACAHPVGPTMMALGVGEVAAVGLTAGDPSCDSWRPIDGVCETANDVTTVVEMLPGALLFAIGAAITDDQYDPPRGERSTPVAPPPMTPAPRPSRAEPSSPALSPAARRLRNQLRMQAAADLCRDAVATLDALRAIDAVAAQLAADDATVRACLQRSAAR